MCILKDRANNSISILENDAIETKKQMMLEKNERSIAGAMLLKRRGRRDLVLGLGLPLSRRMKSSSVVIGRKAENVHVDAVVSVGLGTKSVSFSLVPFFSGSKQGHRLRVLWEAGE